MELKSVAFDLGGVLAYQDISVLDDMEKLLLRVYLKRFSPTVANNPDLKKLLQEAENAIWEIYPKIHFMAPDSYKTFALLKDMHIAPAIWTNNIWSINKWFEQIGIYDYVDPQYICNSIAMGSGNADKPNPLFYKLALDKMCKKPEEVLFIDDSIKNVQAATLLGIESFTYDLGKSKVPLSEVVESRVIRR